MTHNVKGRKIVFGKKSVLCSIPRNVNCPIKESYDRGRMVTRVTPGNDAMRREFCL